MSAAANLLLRNGGKPALDLVDHIEEPERERFREVAERELLSLHEGNFARYQIGSRGWVRSRA